MYICFICKGVFNKSEYPPSSPDTTHLICPDCQEELEYFVEAGVYYNEDNSCWDEEELRLARTLL